MEGGQGPLYPNLGQQAPPAYSPTDPNQPQTPYYYQPGQPQPNYPPPSQYDPNPPMTAPQPVVMTTQGGNNLLDGLLAYPSLLVKQKPRGWCMEYMCNCEYENEYSIYNPQEILVAREHSTCFQRQCCGNARAFDMTINTLDGNEVVRFERPWQPGRRGGLFCCMFPFCFQIIRVFAGNATANPGAYLGWVRENYSFCVPVLSVFDANDDEVYRIVGNCCGFCNYTLHIYDAKNERDSIGKIQKRWAGLAKELFTDADNFFVTFPPNSTSTQRALLLGALFLIDFLYFENNNQQNQ